MWIIIILRFTNSLFFFNLESNFKRERALGTISKGSNRLVSLKKAAQIESEWSSLAKSELESRMVSAQHVSKNYACSLFKTNPPKNCCAARDR